VVEGSLPVRGSSSDHSESNAPCVTRFCVGLLHAEEVYCVLAERVRKPDLAVAKGAGAFSFRAFTPAVTGVIIIIVIVTD
jgi:hypothetical protein